MGCHGQRENGAAEDPTTGWSEKPRQDGGGDGRCGSCGSNESTRQIQARVMNLCLLSDLMKQHQLVFLS